MAYEVEFTDEFEQWWQSLSLEEKADLDECIDQLEEHSPNLGRPIVDRIRGSKYHNMKEIRCDSENERGQEVNLRVLFMFDPRRCAILLIGGDKSGQWNKWYKTMIPKAEEIYEDYLEELKKEGLLK